MTSPAHSRTEFALCAVGIYVCFLLWGLLQERIATRVYQPPLPLADDAPAPATFTAFVFLNTCQAAVAAIVGASYLAVRACVTRCRQRRSPPPRKLAPEKVPRVDSANRRGALLRLGFVAFSSALASPFGYASLKHIDYPTMLLAKSCKMLPVLAASVLLHRRRFPPAQYLIVAMVTFGVCLFVFSSPISASSATGSKHASSSVYGLFLLACNLVLDGVTNATQDAIFRNHGISSFQMMLAINLIGVILMVAYLAIPSGSSVLALIGHSFSGTTQASPHTRALASALEFVQARPAVLPDILAFSACGALGQIFIFHMLARFGSLSLVAITVTRKMFSIILSVVLYNHTLSLLQWVAVAIVFLGIYLEARSKRPAQAASTPKIIPTAVDKKKLKVK